MLPTCRLMLCKGLDQAGLRPSLQALGKWAIDGGPIARANTMEWRASSRSPSLQCWVRQGPPPMLRSCFDDGCSRASCLAQGATLAASRAYC